MLMESVAGFPWTRWPNVRGLGGRMTVEYAVAISHAHNTTVQGVGGGDIGKQQQSCQKENSGRVVLRHRIELG